MKLNYLAQPHEGIPDAYLNSLIKLYNTLVLHLEYNLYSRVNTKQ